jgi:hypothetical protein
MQQATADREPVTALTELRANLSDAILREDWDQTKKIHAEIVALDENEAIRPDKIPEMVGDFCRDFGTKKCADLLGFSRQAILAVAARVQNNSGVLFCVQQRVHLLVEFRARLAAKPDAAGDRG